MVLQFLVAIIMITEPKKRKAFSIQEKNGHSRPSGCFLGNTCCTDCQKRNCAISTEHCCKSRKDTEKCYAQCGRFSGQRKSLKQSPFEELEILLPAWFKQAKGSSAVISGSLLREKALHIATRLGIEDFKASNGWITGFKQRHSVVYKTALGDCKSVDSSTVEEWRKEQLLKIFEGYEPKNIYNADETVPFFRLPPNKTLSLKGDPCNGGKNSKERITVLLARNADGTDKLPPFVIWKIENPHCFKNVRQLPTKCVANRKAWVTQAIFRDYLRSLDAKMRSQNTNILLFLDQCSAHPQDTSYLKNVKVVFFPPYCTSILQPLDQGIIRSFKH
jgi:hypothetical protein